MFEIKVQIQRVALITAAVFSLAACAPEVGSDKWCENLAETPKGEWSANEAGDYAKHCVFK